MGRTIPNVLLLPCPESYARFLGEGWDSVQEAFDVKLSPALVEQMEDAQREARKANARGKGMAPLELRGVVYRMHAIGTRGARWKLEAPDWILMISAPGTNFGMSIRYLSHALWAQGGADTLRDAALSSLSGHLSAISPDQMRLTRADYCFDFHSPTFTREHRLGSLLPRFVCHSSSKPQDNGKVFHVDDDGNSIGKGPRGQTGAVGSKANIQNTIYNKSDEITEASGKEWLYELWARAAEGEIFDKDVHRIETRFGSAFFRNRNLRTPREVFAARREIVVEALYRIRLTVKRRGDSNRSRWPMHPLWSEAVRRCGTTEMVPLGRKVTGRRDVLVHQGRARLAGDLRSHIALMYGDVVRTWTADQWRAAEIEECNAVIGVMENDERHETKLQQATLRYSEVGKAR